MAVDTQVTTFSEPIVIYGLLDPRTQECRYVGKAKNAQKRLKEHFGKRALQRHTHFTQWIKSLKNKGLFPDIVILEETNSVNWKEAEIFWIGYMKFLGAKLTNGTSGGQGGDLSVEAREKQATALRGRKRILSPEHRAKITAANQARAKTAEWRRKISVAAKRRCQRDPITMKKRIRHALKFQRANGPYKRNCTVCGTDFESKTKPGKFCGAYCRGYDFRVRHQRAA